MHLCFGLFSLSQKPCPQATAAATATLPCQEKLETPSIVKVDFNSSWSIFKYYKWAHSLDFFYTRLFLLILIWRWWRRTRRRRCSGMVLPQNRSPQQLSRYSAILIAVVSRLYWLNGCHRLMFYVVNIDFCVSLACKLWKWLRRKEAWSLGRLQRQRFWWG